MKNELKWLKGIYAGVAAVLTISMLAGGALL